MHAHSPTFQGQLIEKNIRPLTLAARKFWKKCQKKGRNVNNIFFVFDKYYDVTHVSTSIFQGLFTTLYSTLCIQKTNSFYKKFFKSLFLKSKKRRRW